MTRMLTLSALGLAIIFGSSLSAEAYRTRPDARTMYGYWPRTGHWSVDGKYVDHNGWRLRTSGWDNTCLRLNYLPSEFACSGRSGN